MGILRSAAKVAFATADLFFEDPSGPRILIYHQVGAGLDRQMAVKESDFECQLDWLVDSRQVVDLDSAIALWNQPNSEQLAAVTFDDGYRDVYTNAFPLLADRQIPFTLYVTTGFVEGEEVSGGAAAAKALSWSMIREMLDSGLVTVGAHTHSHPDVRELDEAEVAEELKMSDDIISSRLGITASHFAYPWGYWSETADRIVRARYSSAALGARHPRSPSVFDPWMLFRVPIQLSDQTRWFEARMNGGLLAEEWARRLIRRYEGP